MVPSISPLMPGQMSASVTRETREPNVIHVVPLTRNVRDSGTVVLRHVRDTVAALIDA